MVVRLSIVGGDEISTVPCPCVDRNQVVKFNLKVDDQGMMKNKRDLESSQLALSSCVVLFHCVYLCVVVMCLM